ncbi:unnamed protein product [Tilletia controversa]|uniref:RING-type E3 ubiquitin transferase n=2 Tax=Tilletia TaxID=13289 RepID=A0A8X7SZQ5_9BASI|nr:hypothetical protein CF336_g152 [Tilletia laevis]KAE8205991.1 hypothetical protein CF328_g176 [Tilletia controversa]KAE8264897.1 hypothetical protein A4X03_0g625 [Tilletia caries]KAE8208655.1 hypothetical protein CF335_g254 [Tilletia laevis]KAE8254346.1 hypothetical protein A4X06_0g940 [Tilletia controversa]
MNPKRRRLSAAVERQGKEEEEDLDAQSATLCIICLTDRALDQTLLPACSHSQYCFLCIVGWATLPRPSHASSSSSVPSCPLCKTPIGPYVLHHLRAKDDASKHYLRPPATSLPYYTPNHYNSAELWRRRGRGRRTPSSQQQRHEEDPDDSLERTLAFRRRLYTHLVFSKHIASNRHTRWKPLPPPSAFRPESGSGRGDSTAPTVGVSNWSPAVLQSRALAFLRRELLLFPHLHALDSEPPQQHDVQPGRRRETSSKTPSLSFVTTYIFSLLQTLDLRSETMTRLLAEFLCPQGSSTSASAPTSISTVAELFAHELASWLRSPYRRLEHWDRSEWLQYDFSGVATSSRNQPQPPNHASIRKPDQSRSLHRLSPPPEEPQVRPPTSAVDRKEEVRDLRTRLLDRLEAERLLAQSHLATRLPQEDPSFRDDNNNQRFPSEPEAEAEGTDGGVDADKEARLKEVLRARMAERKRASSNTSAVVEPRRSDEEQVQSGSHAADGAGEDVDVDVDREGLLRKMLRCRSKALAGSGSAPDIIT